MTLFNFGYISVVSEKTLNKNSKHMKTLLSLQSMLQSPRLAVVTLLLAAAPASQLHADAYSDYVTGLNPQYFLRLSETPPNDAQSAANLGSGAAASYQSIAGSTFVTTGPTGGAIPGNAGVTTDGWVVRIPDSTLASGFTPFSFNLFAKPTSFAVNDFGTMFHYGNGLATGNSMILTEDGVGGTGQVTFGRYGGDLFSSVGSMTAGQWNSVGITYNGSNTIKLYLNGALDTTYVSGSIAAFGNEFAVMGAEFVGGIQRFAGGLDELAYFNGTVLTDAQMINVQTIPEPGTAVLLGLSAGAFALLRRNRSTVRA